MLDLHKKCYKNTTIKDGLETCTSWISNHNRGTVNKNLTLNFTHYLAKEQERRYFDDVSRVAHNAYINILLSDAPSKFEVQCTIMTVCFIIFVCCERGQL